MTVARKRLGRSGFRLAGILGALILQACGLVGNEPDRPGGTSRGYFSISVPGPFGTLHLDSSYQMHWVPSPEAEGGTVRIALFHEDDFKVLVAASADNNGTHALSLPSLRTQSAYRIGTGSRYRLRIASTADTSKWDFSPYFNLYSHYSGSMDVTDPDGGSLARLDSSLTVRWTRTGNAGTYAGMQLYKDTSLVTTITTTLPASGTGFHSWSKVQSSRGIGDDYRIRVFSVSDPSISGMSEPFRIASAYDGSLSLEAPGSGDTLDAGDYLLVRWKVGGKVGPYAGLQLYRDSLPDRTMAGNVSLAMDSTTWRITPGLASGSRYRVRITSQSDTTIQGFSGYFTIRGVEPDEFEGDDRMELAGEIPLDGTAQKRTLSAQDADWIRFPAVEGKRYVISLRSAITLSAGVYDSAGSLTGSSRTGSEFQIVLDPAYTGRHHLRIWNASLHGDYAVAVKELDPDDTFSRVEFLSPDTGDTWAAGSAYTIRWVPDSLFYGRTVALALYRDTALVSNVVSSLSNSGSYGWSVPSGIQSSDRYRIRIANYANAQIHSFSPYFTVSGVAADAYEPDNTQAEAKSIAPGDSAQARTVTLGDVDWIRFQAVSGRKYLAVFAAATNLSVAIHDSLGQSLATRAGSQLTLLHAATRPGIHYLRVSPGLGYGAYTVRLVEYEGGDGGFPVSFIAPDSTAIWAAGSAYAVTWTPDTLLFSRYVSLALYRDTLLVQQVSASLLNTGSASITLPSSLASGSAYRIRIAHPTNSAIYGQSRPFTVSGLAPDSLEPNDVPAEARPAAVNQGRQALSLTYRDRDWFRFEGRTGRLYLIQAASSNALPTSMRLASGGGAVQLAAANKTGADSLNSIAWVCPSDGEYLVSVEPYSGSASYSGPYAFEIKEEEPAAFKFIVTAPAEAAVVQRGQPLAIQWTDPSGIGGMVDLFLYNGEDVVQTVAANVSNTGAYNWLVPAALEARDGYHVRIISRLSSAIQGSSAAFAVAP